MIQKNITFHFNFNSSAQMQSKETRFPFKQAARTHQAVTKEPNHKASFKGHTLTRRLRWWHSIPKGPKTISAGHLSADKKK